MDRSNYESTLDETALEQIDSLRIIKKEIIDLSDVVDMISGIVVSQGNTINSQKQKLSQIRSSLKGEPITTKDNAPSESAESGPSEEAENRIPPLYSVRRSPFYQKKITQLQLNDHILQTRK